MDPNYIDVYALSSAATLSSLLISLAVTVVFLVARWKVFQKAGKPGWASIIPFYADYCLYDIAMGNGWLFLLTFVPCVAFVMTFIVSIKLAKAFNRRAGFGIGLALLNFIFYCILGFGEDEYIGPQ